MRAHMRKMCYMANNLIGVWGTVGSIALAVLILLVMITVHEFGHYLAGKLLKFKIDEFSIGFGPALFKRRSRKTGELFALRLIPLGGYCAFAGEDGEEAPARPSKVSPAGREEASEPFIELTAPSSGEEGRGMPAEGGDARPDLSSDVRTSAQERDARPDPPSDAGARDVLSEERARYFTNKKPWQRIVVLLAGACMNYLLALLLIVVCFFACGQTMVAVYETEPSDSIPAEYCLQDRDVFLQAEGRSLYLTADLARALNGKKQGDLVELRVSRVVGTDEAGNDLRREVVVKVQLRSDVNVQNSADLNGVWKALGVKYVQDASGEGYMLANAAYKFGFFQTLGRAFVYSFKIAGSIFQVLGELLTGKLGLSALGGPVTTIAMTSQIAGGSLRGFLEISGFIGVNLAVFNLLPIPALDGSKIVFTLIEWIRKKPVSRKVEAVIHAVGFVLLLGFAILVDILQFI